MGDLGERAMPQLPSESLGDPVRRHRECGGVSSVLRHLPAASQRAVFFLVSVPSVTPPDFFSPRPTGPMDLREPTEERAA